MKNQVLNYLETLIEKKYGDLHNNTQIRVYNFDTGELEPLSVKEIVRLIHKADEEFNEDENEIRKIYEGNANGIFTNDNEVL